MGERGRERGSRRRRVAPTTTRACIYDRQTGGREGDRRRRGGGGGDPGPPVPRSLVDRDPPQSRLPKKGIPVRACVSMCACARVRVSMCVCVRAGPHSNTVHQQQKRNNDHTEIHGGPGGRAADVWEHRGGGVDATHLCVCGGGSTAQPAGRGVESREVKSTIGKTKRRKCTASPETGRNTTHGAARRMRGGRRVGGRGGGRGGEVCVCVCVDECINSTQLIHSFI